MLVWDELVSTALMGTEREIAPSLVCDGALGKMLERLKERANLTKEGALLSAAAMVELYKRAGALTIKSDSTEQSCACPEDELPECSFRAGMLLSTLIEDRNTGILTEWLTVAKQFGKRPPSLLLPRLLELASYDRSLRQPVIDLAGHRTRWLATHNPAWSFLLQAEVDDADHKALWETGQTPERLGALRVLRRTDPASALALLTKTWSEEPADARIAFIAELQNNLSMADEPFLEERGLDDKRKEVRETSAQLLAKLPESRLIKRMIARVEPRIEMKRHDLYSELQVVSLPEQCDKAMIRDGISLRQQSAMGEKADWLMQMLSIIHPGYWNERFEMDANKLTTIAQNSKDWRRLFLSAWRVAAERHQSTSWAEALIPLLAPDVGGLMSCLSQQQRESFFLEALTASNGLIRGQTRVEQALYAMLSSEYPLSEHCSRILLEKSKKELTSSTHYTNPILSVLPAMALRLNLSAAGEVTTGWREDAMEFSPVRKVIDSFIETVQFRHEMLIELSSP